MIDVHDQLNATQRARRHRPVRHPRPRQAPLDAQLADAGDGRLGHPRAMFHGDLRALCVAVRLPVHARQCLAFRRDPDYPPLLPLEHYDEEADTARKAALFTRRTLTMVVELSTAGRAAEALAASVQWRGWVDPGLRPNCLGQLSCGAGGTGGSGQVFLTWPTGSGKTTDDYPPGKRESEARYMKPSGSAPTSATSTRLEQVQTGRPAGGHRAAPARCDSGP